MKELLPEDYKEPACPFCKDFYTEGEPVTAIPLSRIMEKLDEHLAKNDYAAAERHLFYWLAEAEAGHDGRGSLSLHNELMGHFRKQGKEKEARAHAEKALALLSALALKDSVTAGTTYINAATVYKAFGDAQAALPLYRKAESLYNAHLPAGDERLGGLYNNMGLALVDLTAYREAEEAYRRALSIMSEIPGREPECAVTHLNMATAAEEELGMENAESVIEEHLAEAEKLLETPGLPRNGYYAFVAEKCASVFGYYGHFAYADELKARAEAIYAGA